MSVFEGNPRELDPEPLKLFCCPISGGGLVAQLALLKELSIARSMFDPAADAIRPNIFMGSSGGNIAGYIGMAADWKPCSIDRIAKLLDSEMLLQSWWPERLDFLPTELIGIFSKSLYKSGFGTGKLFSNLFNLKTITSTEIWTGVFSKKSGKQVLFCNKREGETYINRDTFESDRVLFNCEPLTYTNGDIELLSQIAVASASIPILTSEQKINGSSYSDGGILYASPLTVFYNEIFRVVKGDPLPLKFLPQVIMIEKRVSNKLQSRAEDAIKSPTLIGKGLSPILGIKDSPKAPKKPSILWNKEEKDIVEVLHYPKIQPHKLQLTYFSCYDIDSGINWQQKEGNLFSDTGTTINRLVESLSVIDRARGLELLRLIAGKDLIIKHKHYPHLTTFELSTLLQEILNYKHYVLNLYPHDIPAINMFAFTEDDIVRVMDQTSSNYGALVWYII